MELAENWMEWTLFFVGWLIGSIVLGVALGKMIKFGRGPEDQDDERDGGDGVPDRYGLPKATTLADLTPDT